MVLSDLGSIWFVHPYAGGPGVGRYDRPFYLARHWQTMGHRVVVLTPSEHHLLDTSRAAGVEQISGVTYEFIRSPAYKGNGLGRLVNMATFTAQLVRQAKGLVQRHGRPKMIIGSSPHPYSWLAVEHLASRFGSKSVFEVRDLWPLSLVELGNVAPTHPLVHFTRWLEKRAYRKADAVVSLLPLTLAHMIEAGLETNRWHYIPNGIEPDEQLNVKTSETPSAILARQWRNEGRTVVVYAGALGRPNHIESLVQAMAIQRNVGISSSAIIVGRGEQTEDLRKMIYDLHLDDRVKLFEQIPKTDVLGLLREASVGYISLRPEAIFRFGVSPNKLFDYMIARLPVIFAMCSGNNPVAEAGCGISANPGDPQSISDGITRLATMSEDEREAMGARGRAYVIQRHSYHKLAEEYLRLMTLREE